MKKIALCFLISYKHIVEKEQLWIDWIKENDDIINIYFHYTDISKITSQWIKKHIIPPQYIRKTSYLNVVPAYMSLLQSAKNHDKNNHWFCMLTDSCVPIISPTKFRQIFTTHSTNSIFSWKRAWWNVYMHKRANLRLIDDRFRLAHDPWFVLTREHVDICLLSIKHKHTNPIYNTVLAGGLANESIFAILFKLANKLSSPDIINSTSTWSDWSRMSSSTSPYVFKHPTNENIQIIHDMLKKNKYTIFLRKVDKAFPDDAIKKIMNTNFGHTYSN